jgi:hypothetical protein
LNLIKIIFDKKLTNIKLMYKKRSLKSPTVNALAGATQVCTTTGAWWAMGLASAAQMAPAWPPSPNSLSASPISTSGARFYFPAAPHLSDVWLHTQRQAQLIYMLMEQFGVLRSRLLGTTRTRTPVCIMRVFIFWRLNSFNH